MSVTPGLGSFNKDKVASKFGIQLKTKETSKSPSSCSLSPSTDRKVKNEEITSNNQTNDQLEKRRTSSINETEMNEDKSNDQSISNQTNFNQCEKIKEKTKTKEKISDETSSSCSSPTKMIEEDKEEDRLDEDLSQSERNHSILFNSNLKKKDQTLNDDEQQRKTFQQRISSIVDQSNCFTLSSTTTTTNNSFNLSSKSEAEIELKKDQPLYKRQSSKTFDHSSIVNNSNKLIQESNNSTGSIKRADGVQQHVHHDCDEVVLEDDVDPPFAPRIVNVKKNKSLSEEYEMLEFLGRGKFGEVKKCREKSTKHLLAAKFIQINKDQDRIEAHNEIEIMKALQHPRLLQLYDAFENRTNICLIMELINGGELFERVIDDDFVLTERLCELYMMQICEGVLFMHSCNIIHLDMKPENILCVNRDGHRIKIIDFGLARKFDPKKQLKVLFGTPEFVAPEVINFDRIGFGTDMWSVGVICYVLLSGLSPFMGDNDNDTYTNINRVNYDFDDEAFEDISDEAKDFISKLLVKDKDQRLQAKHCLSHPWLTRRTKTIPTQNDEETAEKILSTKKLRRFVIRRRWQKAVNALLALQRMGMTL